MTLDTNTIGIILTFIIGVVNFIITWRGLKQTTFINSVTTERTRWMGQVREKMTEFCKSCQLLLKENDSNHKHFGEILYLSILMKLLLNRSDPYDSAIIEQMEIVKQVAIKQSERIKGNTEEERKRSLLENLPDMEKELFIVMEDLISKTQDLLKLEWEGVKEESYYGRLGKEKKQNLYNRYLRNGNEII
jgi:hypothetical protein